MEPSASTCRVQEAHHRERAANARLENVRIVAETAADAWAVQAEIAESREAARSRTRAVAQILLQQRRPRER